MAHESHGSLDRGLQLLTIVRQRGSLRVVDAAAELGVAVSTAHRLLHALAARGYLTQDSSRRYLLGPEFAELRRRPIEKAVDCADTAMMRLAADFGVSVSMLVRTGGEVRFVRCIPLGGHVTDRRGWTEAAYRTSGGLALLARLPYSEVERLYSDALAPRPVLRERLRSAVREARERGFGAITRPRFQVFAVGMAVTCPETWDLDLAITVAMPVSVVRSTFSEQLISELAHAKRDTEASFQLPSHLLGI